MLLSHHLAGGARALAGRDKATGAALRRKRRRESSQRRMAPLCAAVVNPNAAANTARTLDTNPFGWLVFERARAETSPLA